MALYYLKALTFFQHHSFAEEKFNCNNSSFVMRINRETFDDAVLNCQKIGSNWSLALPSTAEVKSCLKNNRDRYHPLDQRASVWVGFFNPNSENWTDIYGNELKQISWAKTKSDSGSSRRCAIFHYNRSKFIKLNCSSERPYMCQKCEFSSLFSHYLDIVVLVERQISDVF